jgi:hypothetical protein
VLRVKLAHFVGSQAAGEHRDVIDVGFILDHGLERGFDAVQLELGPRMLVPEVGHRLLRSGEGCVSLGIHDLLLALSFAYQINDGT